MDKHNLNNELTKLHMKAQLLGKVPTEKLNLRDTKEKIAVGFLAAWIKASEAMDKLETMLAKAEENRKKSLWERIKEWLSQ